MYTRDKYILFIIYFFAVNFRTLLRGASLSSRHFQIATFRSYTGKKIPLALR